VISGLQPPLREQAFATRNEPGARIFGNQLTFGGSSGGNIKRLSCFRLEKLSTLRIQKPMMPRQRGMEIISGKSSMKQTSIATAPMIADIPGEYPIIKTPLLGW
jgi:hypothetical protein